MYITCFSSCWFFTYQYIEFIIQKQIWHIKLGYVYDQSLSAILEQRDTNGLTAENSELKLRLQTMEQQVHLQDGKDLY